VRLRPRRKPEQAKPAEHVAPAPAEYRAPDPLSWHQFRRQFPGGKVPRLAPLPPSVAEAQARAEHARRQAEQQAERARLAAELEAEKAKREAYVDGLYEKLEAESLWIDNSLGNGQGDVRRMKF
jgi:hypothetical protein